MDLNLEDLSSVDWVNMSVATTEMDIFTFVIELINNFLMITKIGQGLWADLNHLSKHVPENGFWVWWSCQGASVDIPRIKVEVVYKVVL